MVDDGKVLETKRNRESFMPQVERALHLWFCEIRSKPHAPPINQALLIQKSTLQVSFDTHDIKSIHSILFHLVRFDTHDIYFKSHCTIHISIKIRLSTLTTCFIFSVLPWSLVIQTGKRMDHLFIGGSRGIAL